MLVNSAATPTSLKPERLKGFTLVELSIVFVTIGLIIIAVGAAQSLLSSAHLRSTISDITQIHASVNSFKMLYNAYPGDMANFKNYFPSCIDRGSVHCNGDGNGIIDSFSSNADNAESNNVYSHLTLTKLYPGYFYSDGSIGISPVNTPYSKINKGNKLAYAFWRPDYNTYPSTSVILYLARPGYDSASDNYSKPYYSATTPIQAQYIDMKLDDNNPANGKIISFNGMDAEGAINCTTGTSAEYNLTINSLACMSYFFIN